MSPGCPTIVAEALLCETATSHSLEDTGESMFFILPVLFPVRGQPEMR